MSRTIALFTAVLTALMLAGVPCAQAQASEKPSGHRSREATSATLELKPLHFAKGSSSISRSEVATLEEIVRILTTHPMLRVSLEGHTSKDEESVKLKEHALSLRRAKVLYTELIKRGIDSQRMRLVGLGSEHPLHTNASHHSDATDRRVEIHVVQ
jgi:outer membrane protein OmpA-like peptidoglycan-associated protein